MKKSTFFSDFKEFITKGNIIDMAVGVVIGGAFGKIVTGLVNYIINPFIALLTGGVSLTGLKTIIEPAVPAVEAVTDESGNIVTEAVAEKAEVAILWGEWLQTILDFIIVAFCIFLVLRVIMKFKNKLEALKKKEEEEAKEEAPAEPTTEEKTLAAIEDIKALLEKK